MQALLNRGVATRRGIMCAHREPAYSGFAKAGSLLESEKAQDQCMLIPLYPQMTEEEQDYVVAQISEVLTTRF
jgi:dTDP-4-amino-4,6-dideoxygalactose transaminase